MECRFHECIGHGCHHVIMGMMATFTNVFLWSSTPGLIRRPVDQLSFVVPWTPVRMFPQQVCLLRSSPPHHNPLYCRLYLYAVSFIFENIFCFWMSFVMWSRWLEHGTWPGCFVNLEMVCTIFPRDTRTPVSCCVLCQVM